MKNNQKGFSAIELLIVIVIVGLIGAVGWLVYDRQKTAIESDSKSNKVTSTVETKADPINSWLSYTSENQRYSMSIPDGWDLTGFKGEDYLEAWEMKSVTYRKGDTAKVTILDSGGRDGSSIAVRLSYNTDTHSDKCTDSKVSCVSKVKDYTTPNQVSVAKYSRIQTTGSGENFTDIPKGTTEYVYVLTANDKKITIVHDVRSGETDQTQYIEDAIATLKFL